MVGYAEKRLPEFRSAYDKLTHCAKEMTLLYEDIFATAVRDPKRVVFLYIYTYFVLFDNGPNKIGKTHFRDARS